MTRDDLKLFLLDSLQNAKEASGGKQIICQCKLPGCNDIKQHLYIGRFDSIDEPVYYNCFKCHQSGVIGKDFFNNYGLDIDSDLQQEILKSNKGSTYRSYNKGKQLIYNLQNKYISQSSLSEVKLKYINFRLGTSLTYEDCMKLKIVLNLGDLLSSNNIKTITRHQNIVTQLNNSFIGFLSRSNSSLNMRNLMSGKVYESIDKKYVNYNIFENKPDNDYYIIPSSVDIDQHVKIYIAEGAFDILGVYFNVIEDKTNSLFIAGKGKAYFDSLEYILITYGIMDCEVHYFVDKDVSDNSIYDIINFMKPFWIDFFIHRNGYMNEKDYGVPKNKIIDQIRKI